MFKIYAISIIFLSTFCHAVQLGPTKNGMQVIGIAGQCRVTHYDHPEWDDWILQYTTNAGNRIAFADVPDFTSTYIKADLNDYAVSNGWVCRYYEGGWQIKGITNWDFGFGYVDALLYTGSTLTKHYRFPAGWRYAVTATFWATNRFIKPVSPNTSDTAAWSSELNSWVYIPQGVLPEQAGNGAWEIRPSGDFNWNVNLGGQEGTWYAPEINFTNNPNASTSQDISPGISYGTNSSGQQVAGYGKKADGTIIDEKYVQNSNGQYVVSAAASNSIPNLGYTDFLLDGILAHTIAIEEIATQQLANSPSNVSASVNVTNNLTIIVTNSFDGLTLWFEENIVNSNVVTSVNTNITVDDIPFGEDTASNIVAQAIGMSSNVQQIASIMCTMTSSLYDAHGSYTPSAEVSLELGLLPDNPTLLKINPVSMFGAEKTSLIKTIITAFCYLMLLVKIISQLNTGLRP